jgi:hypothetical protein
MMLPIEPPGLLSRRVSRNEDIPRKLPHHLTGRDIEERPHAGLPLSDQHCQLNGNRNPRRTLCFAECKRRA